MTKRRGITWPFVRTYTTFRKSWSHGKGGRVSVIVALAGLCLFLLLPMSRYFHVDLGWFPGVGLLLGIPMVLAGAAGVRLYGYELTGEASRDIKEWDERSGRR
jgi:hypothetical protein